jgi:hypothetical protein
MIISTTTTNKAPDQQKILPQVRAVAFLASLAAKRKCGVNATFGRGRYGYRSQ